LSRFGDACDIIWIVCVAYGDDSRLQRVDVYLLFLLCKYSHLLEGSLTPAVRENLTDLQI